ncbi:hypothetical protein P3L10_029055 [Capsicum annuum]
MRNLVKVTRNPNNWYQSPLFFCSGKIYPLFPTVTCDHRRLLISSNWWANTSFEVSGPLVRSLVVTGRRSDFPRPHVSSLYHNFKLLRVLDLGSVNVGNDFPVGLEKMTLLKYLEDLPRLSQATQVSRGSMRVQFPFKPQKVNPLRLPPAVGSHISYR